ncbi:MAG: M23 family metallopeptidase, partial [Gemmatimonadaceae bacterium]
LRGTVAGEPLHFVAAAGAHEALAAAPIDAGTPLSLAVACHVGVSTDSLAASVALTAAGYPLERLRVAPRFSAPPDSALAARMRRESALAAGVSRGSHDTPRLWTEPFRRPRESRVTSTFGSGREFNGAVTSRHMGTDYAGAVGAPVHAANRGVVRLVDSFFLGGNVVYLDHGAGVVTAYLHLSEQGVAVGDTVQRGDVIGKVGATGRVTGPHLHWITRYGAVTVDPASLLRVTAAVAAANGQP